MWRCCWEPRDTGRKPWPPSTATAHQWDTLRLQLWPKKLNYGSPSSFSEDSVNTPQAAALWEWCWECLWAQELWMDHSGTSKWCLLLGLPSKSGRAISSTELAQGSLLCAASLSHWLALLALCLSQHKAVPVITDSMTNILPWSHTVQSYPTPKLFFHWEKWFQVGLMPSITQLCWFWLGKQALYQDLGYWEAVAKSTWIRTSSQDSR